MDFGAARTWPRSTPFLSMPRSRQPTLSPASANSRVLWNISVPVTVVSWVSLMPTISTLSPTLTTPRSTRPVTTVPRPEMVNTSSMGIRNGLSAARSGVLIQVSTASMSSQMQAYSGAFGSVDSEIRAFRAEPLMIGVSSPGKSYLSSSSRTSISTSSSSSGSSTWSTLFRNTRTYGTLT